MDITIIIPGFKSIKFLDAVFESIKSQTYIHKVKEIIYSEGSTCDDSRFIIEKYNTLPIKYVFHDREDFSFVDHWFWLFNQPRTELVAMIHNDDWWYPTHLEEAYKQLKDVNVSAYFSNSISTNNENLENSSLYYNKFHSLVNSKSSNNMIKEFSFEDIATLCLFYTPFHTSAMVVKNDSLRFAASSGLNNSHAWNADRILYSYLAAKGNISYCSQVLAGIRNHSNQHTQEISNKKNIFYEGSIKILGFCKEQSFDVITRWKSIKSRISVHEWDKVLDLYFIQNGDKVIDDVFIRKNNKPLSDTLKRIISMILPYGFVNWYINRK